MTFCSSSLVSRCHWLTTVGLLKTKWTNSPENYQTLSRHKRLWLNSLTFQQTLFSATTCATPKENLEALEKLSRENLERLSLSSQVPLQVALQAARFVALESKPLFRVVHYHHVLRRLPPVSVSFCMHDSSDSSSTCGSFRALPLLRHLGLEEAPSGFLPSQPAGVVFFWYLFLTHP